LIVIKAGSEAFTRSAYFLIYIVCTHKDELHPLQYSQVLSSVVFV